MKDSKSKRVRNEQILRAENIQTKQLVQRVLDTQGQNFMPIHFVCECSDLSCTSEVELTVEEFKLIHQYKDRFFVIPGHEQSDIENIMERHKTYFVVEKPAISAEM